MVWREEQRAIREEMLTDGPDGRTCIGYATFTSSYEEKFARWLDGAAVTLQSTSDRRRLVELHHFLIDLGSSSIQKGDVTHGPSGTSAIRATVAPSSH